LTRERDSKCKICRDFRLLGASPSSPPDFHGPLDPLNFAPTSPRAGDAIGYENLWNTRPSYPSIVSNSSYHLIIYIV